MTREQARLKEEQLGNGVTDGLALSWLFVYAMTVNGLDHVVDNDEKQILRSLARRVADLADMPAQEERRSLWKAHLSLKNVRPPVFIDPELAWYEILPHTVLRCKNNLARVWEYRLLKEIFWQERIKDDRVCRKEFSVQHVYVKTGVGVEARTEGGESGGAYRIVPALADYNDMDKLKFSEIAVDYEKTDRLLNIASDVFGHILEVRIDDAWWYGCGLTQDVIRLRGYDTFMTDVYDHPDELRALIEFFADNWTHQLNFLEKNNLLSLNNGGEFMGTGGYGWCDDLPQPGFTPGRVRPMDMWGYGECQECVSMNPDVFEHFVFPYMLPIFDRFGLNSFGCCEPLDDKIRLLKDKLPRLRKVTVSPWSDLRYMAEELGQNYAYCWKPNPADIAVSPMDEDGIRADFRKNLTMLSAYGCPTEIVMRDVRTLACSAYNAARWTEIAMEEAKRAWG